MGRFNIRKVFSKAKSAIRKRPKDEAATKPTTIEPLPSVSPETSFQQLDDISSFSQHHGASQSTTSSNQGEFPSPISSAALWTRAFQLIGEEEPELIEAYRERLSFLDPSAEGDLSSPEFIKHVVNELTINREEKQWVLPLLGNNTKIREQVERLTKFFLWTDPIVKNALSAQPYAALAWTGVSLLFQLPIQGTLQNEAMLNGLESANNVQIYWYTCQEHYLDGLAREECKAPTDRLADHLAHLYSLIIEYQARVIYHLSGSQLFRAWDKVSGWHSWEEKAEQIKNLSNECKEYIPLLTSQEIQKSWGAHLQSIQKSQVILGQVREILLRNDRRTQQIQQYKQKRYEDGKERDLLRDLACDYEGYKNFNPERVPGTCEWFLNDDRFHGWRDNTSSSLLWVSAGPGCGKSVLSRALIDEHKLSINVTTSSVCYFFFKDGDSHRTHITNALCAILHQLFTQDLSGRLIKKALADHNCRGGKITENFSVLWKVLEECAGSPDAGEIICVLDALDECDQYDRQQLVERLKSFYSNGGEELGTSSKLKFLITSRPYDNIEVLFGKLSSATAYLRFDGDEKSEQINKEINLVIDARLPEIVHGLSEEARDTISVRLKGMGHRTYLWLHLTFNIIEHSPSEYSRLCDVEALVTNLPSEVSEAYEKILSRSKRPDHTQILLDIVLAAARPLYVNEANYALTLACGTDIESHKKLDEELWPESNFESVVKNLCGLFVNVYDSKLFFFHQTAREFLTSEKRKHKWQGAFSMKKSHGTLALACMRYLVLPGGPAFVQIKRRKAIEPSRAMHIVKSMDEQQNTPEEIQNAQNIIDLYDWREKSPVGYTDSDPHNASHGLIHYTVEEIRGEVPIAKECCPLLPYATWYWVTHYKPKEPATMPLQS